MQCQRCSSRRQHAAQHLDTKQDHFLLSPVGRAVRRSVEQWSFPSCCDYTQADIEAAAWDVLPEKRQITNSQESLLDKLDHDWVDEQEECKERYEHRQLHHVQNGFKRRGYYEQLYYSRVKRSDRTVQPHEDYSLEIEDGVVEEDLRDRIERLFSMPLAGDQWSDSEDHLQNKHEEIDDGGKGRGQLLNTVSSDEYLANNQMNLNEIEDQDLEEKSTREISVVKHNPYVTFVRKSEKGFAVDLLFSDPMDGRAEGLLDDTRGNKIGKESPESGGEPEGMPSGERGKEKMTTVENEQGNDMSKSLDTISEFSDSESLLEGSETGKRQGLEQSKVALNRNEQEAEKADIQSQSSKKSVESTTGSSGEKKKTSKLNGKKKQSKTGTKKTKSAQTKHKRDTRKSAPKSDLDSVNIDKINSYLDNLKETTVLRLFQCHLQAKGAADLNSQLIFKYDDVIE